MSIEEIIKRGSTTLGVSLSQQACTDMGRFYEMLEAQNKVMNLTAIHGKEDVANKHFLDSLGIIPAVPFEGARVIDIGSGAGFPGIPIKLAVPSLHLTLLDSLGKRVDFLKRVTELLPLAETTCICARAEEYVSAPGVRESFDIALSRAVANLDLLCELCLPYVRPGGVFIAMKGSGAREEAEHAQNAIEALGGQLETLFEYTIPETDIRRFAPVIRKIRETPKTYPRRFAKMQKSPL